MVPVTSTSAHLVFLEAELLVLLGPRVALSILVPHFETVNGLVCTNKQDDSSSWQTGNYDGVANDCLYGVCPAKRFVVSVSNSDINESVAIPTNALRMRIGVLPYEPVSLLTR